MVHCLFKWLSGAEHVPICWLWHSVEVWFGVLTQLKGLILKTHYQSSCLTSWRHLRDKEEHLPTGILCFWCVFRVSPNSGQRRAGPWSSWQIPSDSIEGLWIVYWPWKIFSRKPTWLVWSHEGGMHAETWDSRSTWDSFPLRDKGLVLLKRIRFFCQCFKCFRLFDLLGFFSQCEKANVSQSNDYILDWTQKMLKRFFFKLFILSLILKTSAKNRQKVVLSFELYTDFGRTPQSFFSCLCFILQEHVIEKIVALCIYGSQFS